MAEIKKVFHQGNKLGEALAWDPNLINRLAMLSPVFAEIKNSGKSRERFEGETLAAAAQLAEVDPEAFVAFVNCGNDHAAMADASQKLKPDWVEGLDQKSADLALDVRHLVSKGIDPLGHIMEAVRPLKPESLVVLDAPFNPLPLKAVLGGMGFVSFAEEISARHWRVYFRREKEMRLDENKDANSSPVKEKLGDADLDVRGLEPPQPLVVILKRLQDPNCGNELTVLIHREPIYLGPELNEIGWSFEIKAEADDGKGGKEFLLRLFKEEEA